MTAEMRRLLASYADRSWLDVNHPATEPSGSKRVVPAYLALASVVVVRPMSEVQVTALCRRPFRATRLILGSAATQRFDLVDLKTMLWSKFRRSENLPLRTCPSEMAWTPELIQWPLEVSALGEVSVCAVIPPREALGEDDLGAELEVVLLGEAA